MSLSTNNSSLSCIYVGHRGHGIPHECSQFVPKKGILKLSSSFFPKRSVESRDSQIKRSHAHKFVPGAILLTGRTTSKTPGINSIQKCDHEEKLFPYIGMLRMPDLSSYMPVPLTGQMTEKKTPTSSIPVCMGCTKTLEDQPRFCSRVYEKTEISELDVYTSFRAEVRFFGHNRLSRRDVSDIDVYLFEKRADDIDAESVLNLAILSILSISFFHSMVQKWFPGIVPIKPLRRKSFVRYHGDGGVSQTCGPDLIGMFRKESALGLSDIMLDYSYSSVHGPPDQYTDNVAPRRTVVCSNCLELAEGFTIVEGMVELGLGKFTQIFEATYEDAELIESSQTIDQTSGKLPEEFKCLASVPSQPLASDSEKSSSKKRKRDELVGSEKDSRFHANLIVPITKLRKKIKLYAKPRTVSSQQVSENLGVEVKSNSGTNQNRKEKKSLCVDYYKKPSVLVTLRSVIVTRSSGANRICEAETFNNLRFRKSFYKSKANVGVIKPSMSMSTATNCEVSATPMENLMHDSTCNTDISNTGPDRLTRSDTSRYISKKYFKRYEARLRQLVRHGVDASETNSVKSMIPISTLNNSNEQVNFNEREISIEESGAENDIPKDISIGTHSEQSIISPAHERLSKLLSHFPVNSSELCTAESVLDVSSIEQVKPVDITGLDDSETPLKISASPNNEEEQLREQLPRTPSEHEDHNNHISVILENDQEIIVETDFIPLAHSTMSVQASDTLDILESADHDMEFTMIIDREDASSKDSGKEENKRSLLDAPSIQICSEISPFNTQTQKQIHEQSSSRPSQSEVSTPKDILLTQRVNEKPSFTQKATCSSRCGIQKGDPFKAAGYPDPRILPVISRCGVSLAEKHNRIYNKTIDTAGEFSSSSDSNSILSCSSSFMNKCIRTTLPGQIGHSSVLSEEKIIPPFSYKALIKEASPEPQKLNFTKDERDSTVNEEKHLGSTQLESHQTQTSSESNIVSTQTDIHILQQNDAHSEDIDVASARELHVHFEVPSEITEASLQTNIPTDTDQEYIRIFTLGQRGKRTIHLFQKINGIIRPITSRPAY